MSAEATILVVEDDEQMRNLLEEELRELRYQVVTAATGVDGLAAFERSDPDVVVTDLKMPAMKGDELLAQLRARDPAVPVILITAFGSVESAVDTIKSGAYHYLTKPFRMEHLLIAVENALRERRLRRRLVELKAATAETPRKIVAESRAMRRCLELAMKVAPIDSPVLLLGESGTGKELLARAIHERSSRRGPFLGVNCSAIPDGLLESQLFGHRRGSFTDAREDHVGLFQRASGGTLLLDEIGDMPLPLQAKLLRVLQEREVHPLGAPAPVPVDVRVIASTHSNLEELVADGRFRADLYYRLNVISIRIPPLRERPTDLVPLIAHVLEQRGRELDRAGRTLSAAALQALEAYSWPGNVRELENLIERALVLGDDEVIGLSDLPPQLREAASQESVHPRAVRSLEVLEREQVVRALHACGGNKAAAARALGIDRKTLYRKLERYDITEE